MSAVKTTDLGTYIRNVLTPQVQETFSQGTATWDLLPETTYEGGTEWTWPIKSSLGSGAVITTEGGPSPAASGATIATATQTYSTIQAVGRITGEAKSALKNGYIDGVRENIMDKVREVQNRADTYANAQIIDAIDDDTSVYGLTRATYNLASSVVEGGSGALTKAMLDTGYEACRTRPRSVQMQDFAIISAYEQMQAYTEISGAQYAESNFVWTAADTDYDIGKIGKRVSYNGKPWLELDGMTNTYVFGTRLSDLRKKIKAPIQVLPLGRTDYSDGFIVVMEAAVVHMNPHKAFRIEALTT